MEFAPHADWDAIQALIFWALGSILLGFWFDKRNSGETTTNKKATR